VSGSEEGGGYLKTPGVVRRDGRSEGEKVRDKRRQPDGGGREKFRESRLRAIR
jgi:hypothetical protein